MKKLAIGLLIALALLGYTKIIWQSGFDAGADVMQCVIASFMKSDGKQVDEMDKGCQRTKHYKETNPLWYLGRNNGGN